MLIPVDLQRWSGMRRRVVIAAALVVAVVALGILAVPSVRKYTGSAPPDQFYSAVTLPPGLPGRKVLGVAHNAGNNARTTAAALEHGADVIEIDVMTSRGVVVAGRVQGWQWLAERVFRGQTLATAWKTALTADIVKLDLQQNDRGLLDALIRFLQSTPPHPTMISTRDTAAIVYLRPRLPADVTLVVSVPSPDAATLVRSDPVLVRDIGGLSVFQGLVTADLVSWAHQRKLLVLAWTVNDADNLDRLLRMDVDGITSANLAILQSLSR